MPASQRLMFACSPRLEPRHAQRDGLTTRVVGPEPGDERFGGLMKLKRLLTACLLTMALGSCDLAEPEIPATDTQLTVQEARPDWRRDPDAVIEDGLEPRFTVTASVVGQAALGETIRMRITTRARFDSPSFEVRAVLPELEVAKAHAGRLIDVSDTEVPAALRADAALARTGTRSDEFEVLVNYPGYWRVVATAEVVGSDDNLELIATRVNHTEFWLYMDGERVVTTADFEASIFPDTIVPAPGPFRYRSRRAASSAQGTAPMRSVENHVFRVIYWNSDESAYQPVAGVKFKGAYYENFVPIFSSEHTTDSGGYFTLSCNTSYDYSGDVFYDRTEFNMGYDVGTTFYGCEPGWDDPDEFIVSSIKGQVWRNLGAAVEESNSRFSQTRSKLPVTVTTNSSACSSTACYKSASDEIVIESAAVWGEYGIFVAAHEYAHAFHEKALGGNEGSGSCPSPHYYTSAHNLQCAFSEGFADFYAAITNQDLLDADSLWEGAAELPHYWKFVRDSVDDEDWCDGVGECPYAYQRTQDGSRAELAVAAFLYDMVDNSNTANYQPSTDDESVSYGGQYIADVVETCQVKQSGNWIRANGLDHLIYCFEKRLSDYASSGYFPSRSVHPTSWSTSASLPGGWSANTIRSLWQGIAYPDGPPPAPPLSAYIVGPTELEPYEQCTWQAIVSGGVPPYSYSWSGGVSGSGSWVSGSMGSSSYIYLTVTSSDSQQVNPTYYVSIYSGADECVE